MQCVILAAGEGRRMRPLTTSRPKVMLPIANLPMIEYLVVAARDADITDFILVVGYMERGIREHFGDGSSFGVRIRYVTQRQQLGTADALKAAADLLEGKFLLLNGDMLIQSRDIKALCQMTSPCLGIYPVDHPEHYGVVTVEGNQVTALIEKSPSPESNLINTGAYLFDLDIIAQLESLRLSERGEYELTDLLMSSIEHGVMTAYMFEMWTDIGAPWNLLDANEALLKEISDERNGTVEDFVTIHGNVKIGEGTIIRAGTYIEGPCVIGKDCRIGPHAYIRGSTSIGDGCHIGHSTEVKNSVIFKETKIPHFNYIGDSVIGSGCNFGAGTKIANLRHDHNIIKVKGYNSDRRKFGAVIGDNVQLGINCSVNVGTVIGSGSMIAPHILVEGVIADKSVIR